MVRGEIPYKVVGGTKFYDRREVKDVMAYLRVLVNPDDEVSWRRIVNVPKRGVGDTSVAKLAGWSRPAGMSFGDAVAQAEEAGVSGKASDALVGPVPAARLAAPAHGPPTWSTRTATRSGPRRRGPSAPGGRTAGADPGTGSTPRPRDRPSDR